MKTLGMCAQCNGFLPAISVKCPHCGHVAPLRALGGAAAALATMGAFSSTLMACYGPACVDASDCYGTYDGGRTVADAAVLRDADATDSGADAGPSDASPADASPTDASPTDASATDATPDGDAP